MTQPTDSRAECEALVTRFGEGWQKANADQIAAVFADDAVFVPAPFEPPVRGRDAIKRYWRDTPLEQAEIAFRSGEIFQAGPWFATEYKCTFRRRRTGDAVTVRGAMFCETAEGLITEMRLYWDRAARRS